MAGARFEWDERKNLSNQIKHGVSFADAAHVFRDPLCVSVKDRVVDGEQRWHSYGVVAGLLLLLVVHTIREEDDADVFRIISARQATRKERRRYETEDR